MTGIVVLNYRGAADTLACLESLVALDGEDHAIYIVDNASGNDERRALLDRVSGGKDSERSDGAIVRRSRVGRVAVTLLLLPTNLGYAGGNNEGVVLAQADGRDSVWILNNDTEVEPSSLQRLRACSAARPRTVLGCLVARHDAPERLEARGGFRIDWITARTTPVAAGARTDASTVPEPIDAVHGAAMFLPRSVLDEVGPLRADLFLYYEELDYALRCRRAGVAHETCPGAIVYHKGGASTGTSHDVAAKSPLAVYYASRNAILTVRRHRPMILPSVVVARLGYGGYVFAKGQRHLLAPAWRGVRDGLAGCTGRTWP